MKKSSKPFHLISKFLKKINTGNALDIGSGMGKNSFFLAKKGFKVEAIDINKKNIEMIKKISKENNWKIKATCGDFKKIKLAKSKYSIILAIQCFNFIKKSEFEKLIEKIKKSIIKNGIIIISVFTIEDPTYKKLIKKALSHIGIEIRRIPHSPNKKNYPIAVHEMDETFREIIFRKE